MASQGQFVSIRYVVYNIATKRPIWQGTCQRRDFPLVVQNLPHGQGGDRAKIMNSNEEIDLNPYDRIFDADNPETGPRSGLAAGYGKTIDDAITDIDDLDTE